MLRVEQTLDSKPFCGSSIEGWPDDFVILWAVGINFKKDHQFSVNQQEVL